MYLDRKITYLISSGLVVALLSAFFFPGSAALIAALLMPLGAAVALLLLRKRQTPSVFRGSVLLILSAAAALYVALLYLAGLEFGFFPALAFSPATVVRHILPITVTVAATELYRRAMVAEESRVASILSYLAAVLAEVLVLGDLGDIRTFNLLMELVGVTVLPALTGNLLYHYIAKRYGILPNLAYRLILALYPFLLPVTPTVPGALLAFAQLLVPLLLLFFVEILFEKKQHYALRRPSKLGVLSLLLTVVLMALCVMLISCRFRFGMIVIASESMEDELKRGDAVIYEQYRGEKLEVGEIILFRSTGQTTVHRIVEIERINSETRYVTRGDANEDNDPGYITDGSIVGVCRLKLPFVGFPTLWLRETLSFE